MKRLGEFLRSVLPADPGQLLFLAGVVCFVIGPRLRWWPQGLARTSERLKSSLGSYLTLLYLPFFFLIVIAGMAGYFLCFWPGKRQLRRVLAFVWLPAATGMTLMFVGLVYLGAPISSVLETSGRAVADKFIWAWSLPWRTFSAFHVCSLGLLLIGIFCLRLVARKSSLPLRILSTSGTSDCDDEPWRRLKILIWIVIGPLILICATLGLSLTFTARIFDYVQSPWFTPAGITVMGLVLVGVAAFVAPKPTLQVVRNSIQWPGEKPILLSLAFPAFIAIFFSVGQYVAGRLHWGTDEFGRYEQPAFHSYFNLNDVSVVFLLFFIFSAFSEELVFRGLLQPTLVRRYGTYRGIFLVGIVWSAFHFPFDFSFSPLSDLGAMQQLSSRILTCLTLGFVLSWLTLAAGSVLPAAVAHALYNFLLYADVAPAFPGKGFVRTALWGVLAYILFRYWPAPQNEQPVLVSSIPTPQITP